ncbi:MAG: ATP synthase F0 subunit B [Oscillospiraceae bacterium]|nr:ATP synthase F0 subunit B [Oscillospiraceae bacterium]
MLRVDINLLFTIINVLVLCVLVRLFLFKPVHKILDERQKQIESDLAEAESAKTEAQALVQQHQEALAGIEEERAQAMRETTQKAAEVYDQIVSNANGKAVTIIKNAEREGERERQAIMRQTQKEIRELVLEATAKVIGAQASDDSELYDQFLEKVGDTNDESDS